MADEYDNSFTQLITAYSQIARNLPRIERLQELYKDKPEFQRIIADVCKDLLEFHSCAYRLLRRGGWKKLFDASWKDFNAQYKCILERLKHGQDLVDREAASHEMVEARNFRQTLIEKFNRAEKDKHDWQLQQSIAWLNLEGYDLQQENLFYRRAEARRKNTCEWILNHPKFQLWLDRDSLQSYLWLKGKPGSGMSSALVCTA